MDAEKKISDQADTLYFDGRCHLCRAEMQKLQHCRQDIALVDIHSTKDTTNLPDRDALLRQLHLKTADGKWLIGLDANIRAWKNTRYFYLWALLKFPPLYWITSKIYGRWATWRYRRLYETSS